MKDEAKKYPGITIINTFNHIETPQEAAAEVLRAQTANRDIDGWAMIGGWPLFTSTLLSDLDPKKVKIVAVDALPVELAYVDAGLAPVLFAQPTFLWGYVSVKTIVDHVYSKKDVPSYVKMDLVRVSKENLGTWARQLKAWGFTDVDPKYLAMPQQWLLVAGRWLLATPRNHAGVPRGAASSQQPAASSRLVHRPHQTLPGVVALDDVTFSVAAGSCHAICGENGAGKSTLSKILSGILAPDDGEVLLDGAVARFASPRDALAHGVAMVHQELAFCENLSVAENLCLGLLPARHGFVQREALRTRALELLAEVGGAIDPDRQVETLSIAEQQLVQIAAAVGSGARVIIFDEPTSPLGERDTERLYELIGNLQGRGVTVLYISHRMPEIFRLCDAITVLRDGRHVATQPAASLDESTLVQLMIGRRLEQYFPAHARASLGPELLRVDHLTSPGHFSDISFSIRAGEVLGLAGLIGAGRSEVARAIFGLDSRASGTIHVRGKPVDVRSPREAMAHGIGLVPEDRKRQGLVLSMLARENTTLPILSRLSRFAFVDRDAEMALAGQQLDRVQVRASLLESPATTMSGGNQQKLVLAKWLAAGSSILILDEPTRGVDVGAKAELHAWIDRLAAEGAAILLISSELPELINLSRRIIVLRGGRIVGELPRERADQDTLLRLMAGLERTESVGAQT